MTKLAYPLVVLYALVSGIVFAVFAVIWLVDPASVVPDGVDAGPLFAKFASGRNLAIDVMVLVLIVLRKKEVLAYFLLTMALIQTYDAGLGFYIGEPTSAIAPIINAAFYVLCAAYLLKNTRAAGTPSDSVTAGRTPSSW